MSSDLDILDQLDAELSAFVSKSTLVDRAKKTKTAINNHRLPHEKRLDLKREMEEIQQQLHAINWSVQANVALFSETVCRSCGGISTVFLQYMERLITTSGNRVDRLSRIPFPHPGIPNEVVLQSSMVEICAECCGGNGFDMSTAKITYVNQPASPRR